MDVCMLTLFVKALIKLTEIAYRKDPVVRQRSKEVDSVDVRKNEKERRKLEQLKQV